MNIAFSRKSLLAFSLAVAVFAPVGFGVALGAGVPTVTTSQATNVTGSSATLNGVVFPNDSFTNVWVDYGTSASALISSVTLPPAGTQNTSYEVIVSLNGLQSNTTYYYRVSAQNSYGRTDGGVVNFTTGTGGGFGSALPSVQTGSATNAVLSGATLAGTVNPRSSPTTYWFEYGTSVSLGSRSIEQSVGSGSSDVAASLFISGLQSFATYYYRIVAKNSFGTVFGEMKTFQTSSGSSGGSQVPSVSTGFVGFFVRGTTHLNGKVNSQGSPTSAWFEYGASPDLGLRTTEQSLGTGIVFADFSHPLTGLNVGATYYFRAAARNQAGVSYGQILSFRVQSIGGGGNTSPPSVPPAEPPSPTPPESTPIDTVSDGVSCLTITPGLNEPTLTPGGEYVFTITYKNACRKTLSNAALKVVLPLEVDFGAANYPVSNQEGNVVTYNIGTISGDFQAAIVTRGTVRGGLDEGSTLIFKADLSYTDSDRPGTLTAYLTATAARPVQFTANIISAFEFLLGAWWFWLAVIVILVVLVFIWLFGRNKRAPDINDEEDD